MTTQRNTQNEDYARESPSWSTEEFQKRIVEALERIARALEQQSTPAVPQTLPHPWNPAGVPSFPDPYVGDMPQYPGVWSYVDQNTGVQTSADWTEHHLDEPAVHAAQEPKDSRPDIPFFGKPQRFAREDIQSGFWYDHDSDTYKNRETGEVWREQV